MQTQQTRPETKEKEIQYWSLYPIYRLFVNYSFKQILVTFIALQSLEFRAPFPIHFSRNSIRYGFVEFRRATVSCPISYVRNQSAMVTCLFDLAIDETCCDTRKRISIQWSSFRHHFEQRTQRTELSDCRRCFRSTNAIYGQVSPSFVYYKLYIGYLTPPGAFRYTVM